MKIKIISSTLVLLVVLFSCDNHHEKSNKGEDEHHEKHAITELKLNDGKKWPMDDHTRQSIQDINSLLAEKEQPGTIADFQNLGTTLDAVIKSLIKGCTMQGAAHDQLHLFLTSFIPKVAALKEGTSLEDAQKNHQEIIELLALYDKTFE